MSIVEASCVLLRLEKPTADLFQELVAAGQKSVNHLSAGVP